MLEKLFGPHKYFCFGIRGSRVAARHGQRRRRLLLACCAVSSALSIIPSATLSHQEHTRIVPIDDVMFSDGKLCVPLTVAMTSSDVSTGLRLIQTRPGSRSYKHVPPITEFPDQISVFARASMLPCSFDPYIPVSPEDARRFMNTLSFTFEWKSQFERRPVEAVSSRLMSPGPSLWPENEKPVPVWSYIFTVKTAGVPVTNDLVITVRSETSNQLSRMVIRL